MCPPALSATLIHQCLIGTAHLVQVISNMVVTVSRNTSTSPKGLIYSNKALQFVLFVKYIKILLILGMLVMQKMYVT